MHLSHSRASHAKANAAGLPQFPVIPLVQFGVALNLCHQSSISFRLGLTCKHKKSLGGTITIASATATDLQLGRAVRSGVEFPACAAVRPTMGSTKAEWLKKCHTILKGVKAHKHAWVFAEPVDPVKLNIPDYFNIIKKPMDLGTVKANMDNGKISTPDEFKEDVLLTFNNAMKYNPPEHDVHVMAKALHEFFMQKWEKEEEIIKQKWRIDHAPSQQGSHISESSGKRPAYEPDFSDDREMSYEEKRELCSSMNKLPGKKLGTVVQIIHDRNPKILQQNGDDPDEIEVDIDKVDDATLRYLDNYVKEALNKKKKSKPA